jgi:hypothetical protein
MNSLFKTGVMRRRSLAIAALAPKIRPRPGSWLAAWASDKRVLASSGAVWKRPTPLGMMINQKAGRVIFHSGTARTLIASSEVKQRDRVAGLSP